ncbi:MAG: hypothetical protein AB8H79_10690 [Myxococcota bacterium]
MWRNRSDPATGERLPGSGKRASWTLPPDASTEDITLGALQVRRGLDERTWFSAPQSRSDLARLQGTFLATDAVSSWLEGRRSSLGKTSFPKVRESMECYLATARAIHDIPENRHIPGPLAFQADTFVRVLGHWMDVGNPLASSDRRQPLGDRTHMRKGRTVLACWADLADEPEVWPGLTGGLRRAERAIPQVRDGDPMPAPTMDSMTHVVALSLGTAGGRRSLVMPELLLLARTLGTRPDQTKTLRVADVDLDLMQLHVDSQHRRSTKRYPRRIPIPHWLGEALAYRIEGRGQTEYLFADPKTGKPPGHATCRYKVIHRLMERGEAKGVVDPRTWRGELSARGNSRNWSWFRAGLQRYLEERGVRASVIDRVVGHKPTSVRGKKYVPARDEEVREAVELIPQMDWGMTAEGKRIGRVEWGWPIVERGDEDSNLVMLQRRWARRVLGS